MPHAPDPALPAPIPAAPLPATGQTTARQSPPIDEPQRKKAKTSGRQRLILRDNFAVMRAPSAEPAAGSSQTAPQGGLPAARLGSHLATNVTRARPTCGTHS
jgi:hypothetical protein